VNDAKYKITLAYRICIPAQLIVFRNCRLRIYKSLTTNVSVRSLGNYKQTLKYVRHSGPHDAIYLSH